MLFRAFAGAFGHGKSKIGRIVGISRGRQHGYTCMSTTQHLDISRMVCYVMDGAHGFMLPIRPVLLASTSVGKVGQKKLHVIIKLPNIAPFLRGV